MTVLKSIPTRFGVFTPTGAYSVTSNKAGYEKKYQEQLDIYKKCPKNFGMSPTNIKDRTTSFIVIDVDRHHGQTILTRRELLKRVKEIRAYIKDVPHVCEDSGGATGGVKIWIIPDRDLVSMHCVAFSKSIQKKFKKWDLEAYPSKAQWIRLPGFNRRGDGCSVDMDTKKKLDTFAKVETFFANAAAPAASIIAAIKPLIDKPKKKATRTVSLKRRVTLAERMAPYFELIWDWVHEGMPYSENIGKSISCPYHEDNNPSAKIYVGEHTRFICCSAGCPMQGATETSGRDALDLLIYHTNDGNIEYTGASIKAALEEFKVIMINPFKKFTPPGQTLPDTLQLAEFIIKQSRIGEAPEIAFTESKKPYRYYPKEKIWRPILIKGLPDVCRILTQDILAPIVDRSRFHILPDKTWELIAKGIARILLHGDDRFSNAVFTPNNYGSKKIPFRNGLLDMDEYCKSGDAELIPFKKEHMITQVLNCDYDRNAKNPIWEQNIQLYLPDQMHRNIFGEFIGSALLPNVVVSRMLQLKGTGQNGKGTVLNVFKQIFGTYMSQVGLNAMDQKHVVGMMHGMFLNADEDVMTTHLSHEAIRLIKVLTGDGTLTIEEKHQQPFQVKNTTKFVTACNELPSFGPASRNILRRILVVPFKVSLKDAPIPKGGFINHITGGEKGKSGIVNWLLRHLKRFLLRGETFSGSTDVFLLDYALENDALFAFIHDYVKEGTIEVEQHDLITDTEKRKVVSVERLYLAFINYTKKYGYSKDIRIHNVNKSRFKAKMKELMSDPMKMEGLHRKIRAHRTSKARGYQVY